MYVIEVDEDDRLDRGRWWLPAAAGYTNLLSRAGLYDEADAQRRASRSRRATARPALEVFDEECELLRLRTDELAAFAERANLTNSGASAGAGEE